MDTDSEIRQYLWDLLDHESGCEQENCAVCLSAQGLYQLIRSRIFGAAVFPEMAIRARMGARIGRKNRALSVTAR